MNEQLPTKEQALELLRKNRCSTNVIAHCASVAQLARETAEILQKKGYPVNVDLVEVGGLLHDLGRSKTHSINHAVVGVEIARRAGMPEIVINIIKRHVGGGITDAEARALGWPQDCYMPITWEEKIVSYADKLIETSERVPIELTLNRLREENLCEAAERVKLLYDEITKLVGVTS